MRLNKASSQLNFTHNLFTSSASLFLKAYRDIKISREILIDFLSLLIYKIDIQTEFIYQKELRNKFTQIRVFKTSAVII